MILEIGLLDALALIAGCGSVSDLRYLDGWQQEHLARAREKRPAGVASLAEWNDALAYLARDSPQETAEDARERLKSPHEKANTGKFAVVGHGSVHVPDGACSRGFYTGR